MNRANERGEMKTVDDLLTAWDAGEPVWTVELGGLGPGYEQAIQTAAMEMARDGRGFVQTDDKEADRAEWDRICTETLSKHDESLGGLSGAQYGAARWLAWQWCNNGGPERLIERAKEQKADTILVSKWFPRASA